MINKASEAEAAIFDAVVRAAERLRGSQKPEWYLRARLDQILDDYGVEGGFLRDDVEPRAMFILKSFAHMALPGAASSTHQPAQKRR
jgi:hypothetical protein